MQLLRQCLLSETMVTTEMLSRTHCMESPIWGRSRDTPTIKVTWAGERVVLHAAWWSGVEAFQLTLQSHWTFTSNDFLRTVLFKILIYFWMISFCRVVCFCVVRVGAGYNHIGSCWCPQCISGGMQGVQWCGLLSNDLYNHGGSLKPCLRQRNLTASDCSNVAWTPYMIW